MKERPSQQLDPERILATIDRLHRRITERFPDASLGRVVGDLAGIGRETIARAVALRRPYLGLRALVALLLVAAVYLLVEEVRMGLLPAGGPELVQTIEAALGTVVYVGAAVFFVVSLESRLKRARVLAGLHRLRSVAHIIDMHQLDKDPGRVHLAAATPSSPQRTLTEAQLGRYYDYCSEALSLTSKIAAVHAQHFNDSVILAAIDEVEMLCTGLSRKIWQKAMLLRTDSA